MCLTEIPGVSGEMGRRPIRETKLIGIPRRVEPAYPCFRARNISTARRGAARSTVTALSLRFAHLGGGIARLGSKSTYTRIRDTILERKTMQHADNPMMISARQLVLFQMLEYIRYTKYFVILKREH